MSKKENALRSELSKTRELNQLLVDKISDLESRSRVKKNQNFVQLSQSNIVEIVKLESESASASKILWFLVSKMNKSNAVVISQKTLMVLTGMGRTSVYTAVKHLRNNRWIDVLKVGTANAYVVNSQVFWKSSNDKKYTSFSAQVITSLDEQESENLNVLFESKLKSVPMEFAKGVMSDPEDQVELDFPKRVE
jgi:hypothetical protein